MIINFLFFNIFFLALYEGLLIKIGFPGAFSLLSEFSIYLLLLISLMSRSGKGISVPDYWQVVVLFLLITPLSSLLNETPLFRSIESLRLIFRFYLLYLAVVWLDPNDRAMKTIILLLLILLICQFPIITVKFIMFGMKESTMGAWLRSGAVTAMLWFSLIFFFASFYFYYNQKTIYIIFGIGCIIATILGAKRVVLFIYPFQFILIYYYLYSKMPDVNLSKKVTFILIFTILLILVSGTIISFNKSLNPENEVGGEIDLNYVIEYANRYNSGINASGGSFGRVATTLRVFKIVFESGFSHFLLGKGPGSTTPSRLDNKYSKQEFEQRYNEFKIDYGFTPMTRILLEYGVFAAIAYVWMIYFFTIRSWRLYVTESDPYWKSFAGGSFGFSCSMLFFFFCYSHSAFWGGVMPALYFYTMAIVKIRLNRLNNLENVLDPVHHSCAHFNSKITT